MTATCVSVVVPVAPCPAACRCQVVTTVAVRRVWSGTQLTAPEVLMAAKLQGARKAFVTIVARTEVVEVAGRPHSQVVVEAYGVARHVLTMLRRGYLSKVNLATHKEFYSTCLASTRCVVGTGHGRSRVRYPVVLCPR